MKNVQTHLHSLIGEVRRQVRRRTVMQGATLTLVAAAACLVALFFLMPALRAAALPPWVAATLGAAATLGTAWWALIRPLRRPVTDRQVALFIEEQRPDLEDRINSATEARALSAEGADDRLLQDLFADAARMARAIVPGTLVRKVQARVITGLGVAVAIALLVFGATNVDRIRLVAAETAAATTPFMRVSPGDVEIEKGESVAVVAELQRSIGDDVVIAYREGEAEWARRAMEPGSQGTAFMAEFASIQAPVTYFVEAGRRRTKAFTISVYEFPAVERIDVTYVYPEHLPLAPRIEEDAGDIVGLEGSAVTLTVTASAKSASAVMAMEHGQQRTMRSLGDGRFATDFVLAEEDLFTIRLLDAEGKRNQFPQQHAIVPIPDEKPHITLRDPGRDLRANAIEEVLVAADAEDDFGVTALDLVFYVGGGEAQRIALVEQESALRVAGEHLLFLEEFSLEGGDVITYYVEARDALQEAVTDLYFIEVMPFDQTYTQVSAAAGGGQGGGQQSGLVVSQQEIIAATWRLDRERGEHEDYDEVLRALVGSQVNLKRSIEERIQSTAFSLELRGNELQQQTVTYLEEATRAMGQAASHLEEDRLQASLPSQREALSALLRADAQNKENQVAQQQRGQGGSGASATEERMSELMDLELDISKDKYEVQQQRAQETQALDQAARTVKDLARRQQDLANLERPQDREGEDYRRFVDRLRREQEEVREQLEQLTRSMGQSQEGVTEGRMASALRNMREADRALRRGDLDEAASRQQQALRDLQRMQPGLQQAARGARRAQLQVLDEDLRQLIDQERQLASELDAVTSQETRPTEEEMRVLDAQRMEQMDALHQAMEEAQRMEAQSQDPELTANLRNLLQQIRRDNVAGDMANSFRALSEGWIESAQRMQEEILRDMAALEERRRVLAASLPLTEEEELASALRQVENLKEQLQGLESDAERLRAQGAEDDRRGLEARLLSQLERSQEQLRSLMQGSGDAQQALGGMQRALTGADHTGVLLDEESAKAFFERDVYEALNQLEASLVQALDIIRMEDRLYGSRRGEVPPEYSDMVERYYESLSRQ